MIPTSEWSLQELTEALERGERFRESTQPIMGWRQEGKILHLFGIGWYVTLSDFGWVAGPDGEG